MKPLIAAASLIVLTACSQSKESEPAFKAPPAAVEAPKAAAPVADPTVLSADGWKSFKIGGSETDVGAALAPEAPGAEPGGCRIRRPADGAPGVNIMLEDGKISRVTFATGSTSKTDKGLAVGDPEARVRAAYPTGLAESPHKYEDAPAKYLTWKAPAGTNGIRYVINAQGVVAEIHAGGPAIEYVEGCS